jgi:hypothetical protein
MSLKIGLKYRVRKLKINVSKINKLKNKENHSWLNIKTNIKDVILK